MNSDAQTPLLRVEGLESGYAGLRVLAGIDLHVNRGETVAVVGGNGAGKTTLIRTITGMIKATAGAVSFGGVPLVGLSTDRICEYGLAQVPEGRQIFASQPVMLMLDEPSLGLAPIVVEQMFRTVAMLASEGMSILLVEQNVAESLRLCQRAYVMENGTIALSGDAKDLLSDDRVRQAYLGL